MNSEQVADAPQRPAAAAQGRRTTLRAVADRAHVSIATVSKVVNGRSDVGRETRATVEEAISALGYVSLSAAALASGLERATVRWGWAARAAAGVLPRMGWACGPEAAAAGEQRRMRLV